MKTQIWKDPHERNIPAEFRELNLGSDIVLKALVNRGISSLQKAREFLDHNLYSPSSPFEFPDMEKAVYRINRAINAKELIGVWGDFDVDGQTSTAILVSTLRKLGARVTFHVPIRSIESHGIQRIALDRFLSTGVSLIITCDTGITANESIAYAKSRNIDVIITDHHTLGEILPSAFAIINPQLLQTDHPLHPLPGSGTAFILAKALLLNKNKNDEVTELHDLAALGIIADVAELKNECRYLVQSGLQSLKINPRPSILAMLREAKIDPTRITEEQIAFTIAPRLNSIGRLGDANPLVEFLLSNDPTLINVTVNQLEGLNEKRKTLCDNVLKGALNQIEMDRSLLDHPVLMLKHPEWPAGIVGIVASRLAELFHKPVILCVSPDGQLIRGSSRSIEGVNITSAISENSKYLTTFGGHPMAAGLSMNFDNYLAFQRGIDNSVTNMVAGQEILDSLEIDSYISPEKLTLSLVREIEMLAPFGQGNPPLVFADLNNQVEEIIPVGKNKEHLQVTVVAQNGISTKLIWWQGGGLPRPEGMFDLAYSARASTYRGKEQVQFEFIGFRESDNNEIILSTKGSKKIEITDFRKSLDPIGDFKSATSILAPFVWKSGTDLYDIPTTKNEDFLQNDTLILWSVPPNPFTIKNILESIKPKRIFVFNIIPDENDLGIFLSKLVNEVLKETNTNRQITFSDIALRTGASTPLIISGVNWLEARGDIRIEYSGDDKFTIQSGGEKDSKKETELKKSILHNIQEIQAFRKYYSGSEPYTLFYQE